MGKQHLAKAEEDKALLTLMEEDKKEGRVSEGEQRNFKKWLFVDRHSKSNLLYLIRLLGF